MLCCCNFAIITNTMRICRCCCVGCSTMLKIKNTAHHLRCCKLLSQCLCLPMFVCPGMMNWVVGTFKKRGTGWTEGYPPDDLFPAEAGKFTLKFDQKSDYDYDYYQAPPHKDERPHRRSYGEPDYQRY